MYCRRYWNSPHRIVNDTAGHLEECLLKRKLSSLEILHFGLQGRPSGGEGDKRYCSKGFNQIIREKEKCWSLFPLEPSPGLGRAIPPSTSSTSPTLSTIYSSRRPAWDGDGGWTELLLLISLYYYPFLLILILLILKICSFSPFLLTSLTWRWRSPSSSSPWSPRDPCSTTVRRRLWKFLSISFCQKWLSLNFCQIENRKQLTLPHPLPWLLQLLKRITETPIIGPLLGLGVPQQSLTPRYL